MAEREVVDVLLDDPGIGGPRHVGRLSRARSGTRSVVAFEYLTDWLEERTAFAIDPGLPLAPGEFHLARLGGVLSDAAPDRWGRLLMDRREALAARRDSRRPRALDDWDYLIGVQDVTRLGGVRLARDGRFLSEDELSVPPATRLRELEALAAAVEDGRPLTERQESRWLELLIAPGSSLGGARPKASFVSEGDDLWLAKFPSSVDRHDVAAWEYLVTRLAAAAAIDAPEVSLLSLANRYRTFCARRFDRTADGRRRLYASAMTLTGHGDGEGASYLDIAAAIERYGTTTTIGAQLGQLFRRVVFNALIGNRDDHLRNHGFLHDGNGWVLAPVFDVNPSPDRREHVLSFDGSSTLADLELILDTAGLYRLRRPQAEGVTREVARVVAGWRDQARQMGIPRDEIERMTLAFADLDRPGG